MQQQQKTLKENPNSFNRNFIAYNHPLTRPEIISHSTDQSLNQNLNL